MFLKNWTSKNSPRYYLVVIYVVNFFQSNQSPINFNQILSFAITVEVPVHGIIEVTYYTGIILRFIRIIVMHMRCLEYNTTAPRYICSLIHTTDTEAWYFEWLHWWLRGHNLWHLSRMMLSHTIIHCYTASSESTAKMYTNKNHPSVRNLWIVSSINLNVYHQFPVWVIKTKFSNRLILEL